MDIQTANTHDTGSGGTRHRQAEAQTEKLWLCPGPGWPPETETCGRMQPFRGRCPQCSAKRTRLRKAERREAEFLERFRAADEPPDAA